MPTNKFQKAISKTVNRRAEYNRPKLYVYKCQNPKCDTEVKGRFWCVDCEHVLVQQILAKRQGA